MNDYIRFTEKETEALQEAIYSVLTEMYKKNDKRYVVLQRAINKINISEWKNNGELRKVRVAKIQRTSDFMV